METHGIKVKDKLGYALGDMGGIMRCIGHIRRQNCCFNVCCKDMGCN